MAQAQLLYIGTDHGVVLLSNPGRIDRWISVGIELADQAIRAVACQADAPMQATVWSNEQAWQTNDGGQAWQMLEPTPAPPLPSQQLELAGQPAATIRIASDPNQLERNDGTAWQSLQLGQVGQWSCLLHVAYQIDSLYAATNAGEVWVSSDRGRTWTVLKQQLAPINALAIGRVIS
ncbi:hypothetical protein [Herpetosiphon llansteffanensis]|uniref:hypothetical protein n=1 Tax=Herpetosiphon llansteffanensis TaxID=2094568 RepID=UPI000D7CB25C|nr:hypothetical protein [Herpetosiphon llansteffanensis]